jgi:hypothetical protein
MMRALESAVLSLEGAWRKAFAATIVAGALSIPAIGAAGPAQAAPGDGGLSSFYRWTDAMPAAPGVLLRQEQLEPALSLPEAGSALRILYTSRSGIDDRTMVAVSGALFLPKGEPPAGGWPLAVWAHGTTGIADVCAPSSSPRSPRDRQYLDEWIKAGFAVVASDYQGLGTPGLHPYSNYRAASYSVLDSIRVATGGRFPIAAASVLVGQSQGAATVVAAAGHALKYAPELAIKGVIATGPPNLSRSAIESGLAWSATDAMVTGAYAMIGFELAQLHSELPAEAVFTPEGMALHDLVKTTCLAGLMDEAQKRHLDPGNTFKPAMLKRLWDTDIDLRSFPTLSLRQPVFFGIGLSDSAALPATTLALVRDMCAANSTVQVRMYKGQDHGGVVNASVKDGVGFARAAIAGEAIAATCRGD